MTTVTNFVWDPVGDCVISELDGDNNVQAVYTNEPQQFGGVISQRRGTTTSTLHADALGTTRLLTGNTQTTTDKYLYDAWGTPISTTGSTVMPFKWVGRYGYYSDDSTGLSYVRSRSYSAAVAMWMSVDPIGHADSTNVYQYSLNSPLRGIDPSGTKIIEVGLAQGGGVCAFQVVKNDQVVATIPYRCGDSASRHWASVEANNIDFNSDGGAIVWPVCDVTCQGTPLGLLFTTPLQGHAYHRTRQVFRSKEFDGADGVSIGIHFVKGLNDCCCDSYEFIQVIKEDSGRVLEFVDVPHSATGEPAFALPYYSGSPENPGIRMPPILPPGITTKSMYDAPYVSAQDFLRGNTSSVWSITTCVVCARETPLPDSVLECVEWGFSFAMRQLNPLRGTVTALPRSCRGRPAPGDPFWQTVKGEFPSFEMEDPTDASDDINCC